MDTNGVFPSHHPHGRRTTYILTIWSEYVVDAPPLWRGYLETADGRRRYFRTLADLTRLLVDVGGWVDPS